MSGFARRTVASVLWLAVSALASAQSVFRVGTEFQVNNVTVGGDFQPAVAQAANGSFVVVWNASDGVHTDIAARRFSPMGAPLGAAFQVNSYSVGDQSLPVVAADSAGNFVVAWRRSYDNNPAGLFARRFDASGTPRGVEFLVNTYTTTGVQPAVAVDSDGDFVVVFSSFLEDGPDLGVFGRRFASSGAAVGLEFQVNAATIGNQHMPSVGLDSDGDFVVTWLTDQGPGGGNVLARRFNAAAVGGAETPVSSFTGGGDVFPRVGVDDDGDFVVAWSRGSGDGMAGGIFARRFNALGGPLGDDFLVNQYTPSNQNIPDVAVDGDGDFVVTWESQFQDGSMYAVFAQAFDAGGARIGLEFQVNTYTPGQQVRTRAASDGKGGFVVVWQSYFQDGAGSGVFGQRFASLVTLDVDGNGTFDPLTDALLILRFSFGFTGATLTSGAIGAGCTRCDSASISAYLQSIS
jgi:hypothetical protein